VKRFRPGWMARNAGGLFLKIIRIALESMIGRLPLGKGQATARVGGEILLDR
jgi:hypothetical protein